ncbi:Interferon-induced GTP-binding protein Mx [Acipenser ruthenus]|uniref:Interferon-induced GTP-binding protein Mx n=1 Tax=Acipenser ruthenus TaxID=7906 RepID=A0A444TWL9_ACIRT|nr:Interferon-induced GTP-binding protein Mx [Acipenser ruthenus]
MKTLSKIASNRLADLVPMAIKYHQIQESVTKLQGEMFSILQKRDLVDELVEEEGTAAEKRRTLIERRERLNKARLALIKF